MPKSALNNLLERELSGYRAIKGKLVPVTSAVEVAEIERAATRKPGFEGVAGRIESALALLGKKPQPDYANSMKKSISADEAAVKLLTGEKSGGIDTALKILKQKSTVNPAIKMALSKLYAYTSDEGGIRHANIDASKVTGAEAKFMLVACSAFANLLIDSSRQ